MCALVGVSTWWRCRSPHPFPLLQEGTGQAVNHAYVEIVFDNSDGRLPVGTALDACVDSRVHSTRSTQAPHMLQTLRIVHHHHRRTTKRFACVAPLVSRGTSFPSTARPSRMLCMLSLMFCSRCSFAHDASSCGTHPHSKTEVQNLLESAGFSRANPYYVVQQGKVRLRRWFTCICALMYLCPHVCALMYVYPPHTNQSHRLCT